MTKFVFGDPNLLIMSHVLNLVDVDNGFGMHNFTGILVVGYFCIAKSF